MTDEQYVEQAIELADEWRRSGKYVVCIKGCQHWYNADAPGYLLDALAGQLTSQLEAIGGDVVSDRWDTEVFGPVHDQTEQAQCHQERRQPDERRSQCEIRGIVESGFLSTAQGELANADSTGE